jgi:hypothetical protein
MAKGIPIIETAGKIVTHKPAGDAFAGNSLLDMPGASCYVTGPLNEKRLDVHRSRFNI